MLPEDFIKRTKDLLGADFDALATTLESEPQVSIRINPKKCAESAFGNATKVPWCRLGRYLDERPSFTFDPLFHAGTYYVQEAASMFIEQIIENYVLRITNYKAQKTDFGNANSRELTQIPNNSTIQQFSTSTNQQIILDLCAAPGGKSTHIISLLPPDSLLVSNEVIKSRCNVLAENMTKWGYPNSIVTNNVSSDFGRLTNIFDIILADLPCSGEGMFRKDKAARKEWSTANVEMCAERQREIICNVWNALKPGGLLIYSTCTFNTEENEGNISLLADKLGAEILEIPTLPEWNIGSALGGYDIPVYRFFPHRTRGEGFFCAILQKNEDKQTATKNKSKNKSISKPLKDAGQVREWIKNYDDYSFDIYGQSQSVRAIRKNHKDVLQLLAEHLRIVSAGIKIGEFKGYDFIPAASLALSTELWDAAFTMVDLSAEDAIKYLQKESLVLPGDTPKGYVLITYKNTPLGFAKNIGNRANNLYQQEWRIRKSN